MEGRKAPSLIEAKKGTKPKPEDAYGENQAISKYPKKREEGNISIEEIRELLAQGVDRIVVHGNTKELLGGQKHLISEPDLDVLGATYLLNTLTKNGKPLVSYNTGDLNRDGAYSEIVPKGSKAINPTQRGEVIVHIDTGEESFSVETQNGTKTIYIDHHGKEKEKRPTSATSIMAEVLGHSDTWREKPWLNNFVKFVNAADNLSYVDDMRDGKRMFNEGSFQSAWPKSLYALYKELPFDMILKLFEEKRDPWKPFTEDELTGKDKNFLLTKKVTKKGWKATKEENALLAKDPEKKSDEEKKATLAIFKDIYEIKTSTIHEVVKTLQETAKYSVWSAKNADIIARRDAIRTETKDLGTFTYHNYGQLPDKDDPKKMYVNTFPPFEFGFLSAKALGNETFLSFNPKNRSVYVNSSRDLMPVFQKLEKVCPGLKLIRGVMILSPRGEETCPGLTEAKFIQILGLK
jgi:hypothetical protein